MESVPSAGGGAGALTPGQVVGGRFEVERAVRTDALGGIYRAKDQKTGRAIGVRLVSTAIFGRQETVNVLREQCRALAKIHHRNLIATFGVGSIAGTQFVATEWADGTPLDVYARDRKAAGQPLTLEGMYHVVAHVAKGLEKLHETACHGAIHPGVVWISDAGRVQVADAAVARAALLCAGAEALGPDAKAFLAPEVLEGGEPTPASDVYGVGALLFALATGRSPADGFVPPSMLNPEANSALDDALLRCLERDPKARFASVHELRLVLHPIVTGVQMGLEDPAMDVAIDVGDRMSKPPASTPPFASAAADDLAVDVGSVKPTPPAAPFSPPVVAAPSPPARAPAPPPRPPAAVPLASIPVELEAPVGERISFSPFAPAATARSPLSAPPPMAPTPSAPPIRAAAGAQDLATLIARITENDALRWMVVKDGLDHGPFSGRDLIQRIVKGEVVEAQIVANMETGQRGPLAAFDLFGPFLEQQKLHHKEAEELVAMQRSEKAEKRSSSLVLFAGLALFALLGGGIYFFLQNRAAEKKRLAEEAEQLFEAGKVDVRASGRAKGRRGRGGGGRGAGGGGGGGGGGGLSYEAAMNEAVSLGDVSTGGEMRQLSQGDVAGTMNKHLGSFNGCVNEEQARGGNIGKVVIDLAILGSGQVRGVTVSGGSGTFQQCVSSRTRGIRFPSFSAPRMGARYSFSVD